MVTLLPLDHRVAPWAFGELPNSYGEEVFVPSMAAFADDDTPFGSIGRMRNLALALCRVTQKVTVTLTLTWA